MKGRLAPPEVTDMKGTALSAAKPTMRTVSNGGGRILRPDIDLTVRVKKPFGVDLYNTNLILQGTTYDHLISHVGEMRNHGRLVALPLQLAGFEAPPPFPSPCLRIDTTPEVNPEKNIHSQDEFTMLGINGPQTISFIDPGEQATGGRSYIIDVLTSLYVKPLPGARVSYDIETC